MNNVAWIIVFIIIILIVLSVIVLRKKISLMNENSVKLKKLDKLNKSFEYTKKAQNFIKITHFVTKKEELSKINIDEVLSDLFLDNVSNSLINFKNIYQNDKNYVVYEKKYSDITDKTKEDIIKLTNLSPKMFVFLEKRLFNIRKIKPIIKTKIKLTIKYDGLNGENEYKKEKTFSYKELINIYEVNNN